MKLHERNAGVNQHFICRLTNVGKMNVDITELVINAHNYWENKQQNGTSLSREVKQTPSKPSLLGFIGDVWKLSGLTSHYSVCIFSHNSVTDKQLYTTIFGKQETPWLESCLFLYWDIETELPLTSLLYTAAWCREGSTICTVFTTSSLSNTLN